ncbi:hypothetical protein PHLGIDRAFT_88390 [Phlebiopsis gigantea 11061_1 CR5-6]|uniref:tripeptidyl-peptidase II n=1 Tax=Phlebiopsis gigantea (strain 11061_1 CR5-6) TaxID=745531 RepID=A0A0C3NSS5_PHLG1|nr:hypothetical protein PHLGIDRAFT_88390 [Phlebiopsis gigantea 11061_1 CR5-6]
MRTALALYLLTLAALTAAVPHLSYTFQVKETVTPPREWSQAYKAPSDLTIDLRIALPQQNFALLEQHLYEVSDPFHERYGQHLSQADVNELIAPHPHAVDQVEQWLESHGLSRDSISRSSAGDWLRVKVPVSKAEEMLNTEYHIWVRSTGETLVRATAYSLPVHLHEHVEFVQPTTLFSTFRPMRSSARLVETTQSSTSSSNTGTISVASAASGRVDASCADTVTIECLRQLYNAVGYTPSANTGNQIGVTGYLGQFANEQDLQTFYKNQVPTAVGSSFTTVAVNGGKNIQTLKEAGGEANLDVQFAFGLAHPIPATFYTTDGTPPFQPDSLTPTDGNEPYLDWVDFVLNHPNPPQVISTSYADTEQSGKSCRAVGVKSVSAYPALVPKSFAQRVCQGFATLGARGVTLTFSSGDFGVGDANPDPATQICFSNDGTNKTEFIPLFPPSCPYVTAVGGTTGVPEVAASFSGGGFSNYFDRPIYQAIAVPLYLTKLGTKTYNGLFNRNGRAIPDVSAQSTNFSMIWQGQPFSADGTSAASPAFAGIVALINDARMQKKKAPLGFLNPLIYTLNLLDKSAFNDITSGSNPGCGTPGFNATAGWDPVTGLGTPNFGVLKGLLM